MPFQEISDDDLTAIISYLRSQPAVKNEVKEKEVKFLGKALLAFGVVKPEGPKETPPAVVNIDSTIEYGSYIANRVANCTGCHTNRDLKTGAFIGEPLAGGFLMPPDEFSEGFTFVTPNLTPDKETGAIAKWSETAFINRFRGGRALRSSPMPWGVFSRMDDVELKAIFRYLQSVPPVHKKIEKTFYSPDEKAPEEI
jgi:mono/diheme cytochrome c family protein